MLRFNGILIDEQNQKLSEVCEKFILDHNITCAETIYQVDSVILDAYEFIEKICDIVGYDDLGEDNDK